MKAQPQAKNRVLGQSVYYAIGIIMMKGVSLLMMPYVTHQLTPEEYGALETLLILADVGTIIIGFGLIEALYRFVGLSRGAERESLITNCFLLSIAVAAIGTLFILVLTPSLMGFLPLGLTEYQVLLIAIPTVLEGVIAIPLTLMRMQSMAKWFCIVNVFKAFLQAGLVIIFLEIGLGIDAILIAGAIASVFLIMALLFYQLRQMPKLKWSKCFNKRYWQHTPALVKYGSPIVASRMGLFAITGLDRWILGSYVGVEALGVYAIAAKFALILGLLMQPFTLWWFPNRFQVLEQPNGPKQCADFALLGVNLGILLAVMMAMTVPAFILLFLPATYSIAATVVIGLAIVAALKNAGDLMNLGCFSGESSQQQMWIQWGCAITAVMGYYFFIPVYGLWAAVGVLGGVYGLRLVLFYIASQQKVALPYEHGQWMIALLCGSVFFLLNQWLFEETDAVWRLLLGGLFSMLAAVAFCLLGAFPNIKLRIAQKMREWRLQNAKQIPNNS